MIEQNALIPLILRLMEFCAVIGMTAVVVFTVARQRYAFRSLDPLAAGVTPHAGPDPRVH